MILIQLLKIVRNNLNSVYLKNFNWSEWQDSNLRPSGPKPDALPGCATLRYLLTPVVIILIGLSNLQNLSSAFNSLVFSVVGCVSIFLFVLVQPISNTNNIIKLYFITNFYLIFCFIILRSFRKVY